ncbi:uncharacterized protein [Hemitrygon akajei]|uniref:uncharacterized protein isoform X3 n=1 Tax=Hemitrygon akajei TaxID=2704970 RepID=UPI003BF9DFEA
MKISLRFQVHLLRSYYLATYNPLLALKFLIYCCISLVRSFGPREEKQTADFPQLSAKSVTLAPNDQRTRVELRPEFVPVAVKFKGVRDSPLCSEIPLQRQATSPSATFHMLLPFKHMGQRGPVFLHEGISGIRTDKTTFVVVLWLGYVNSGLNPIVYAVLNREFRMAYQKLLFCRKRNAHKKGSHIIYRSCQSRNEQCHQLVQILDDNEHSSDITKDTGISKEESERSLDEIVPGGEVFWEGQTGTPQ